MKSKRLRLILAALLTGLIWAALIIYTAFPNRMTLGAYNNWIALHPPPLEIIALTIAAVFVSALLYRWYKQDRVQRALNTLDDEERRRLLEQLMVEYHLSNSDVYFEKPKRRIADEAPETEIWSEAEEDSTSRSQARGIR